MMFIGRKINKNYAWELSGLYLLRLFSDGIDFFEFHINWDRYLADHTPAFEMLLVIFNFKIFEFTIYYIWHRNDVTPVIRKSPCVNNIEE